MASKIFTGARIISDTLISRFAWPSLPPEIVMAPEMYKPLHIRAHLPRDLTQGLLHSFVVCGQRVEAESSRDRCSMTYAYRYTIVFMKVFTEAPDDDPLQRQPSSQAELDALMEFSELMQDDLTQLRQYATAEGVVNVVEFMVDAMPDEEEAAAGVWVTSFTMQCSVRVS